MNALWLLILIPVFAAVWHHTPQPAGPARAGRRDYEEES